jgi:hypothetical protein
MHRVSNLSGNERFFFGVDYDTTISVMGNQVSDDNPPCKEPFKAGEVSETSPVTTTPFSEPRKLTMSRLQYVAWKLSKTYIGYGGEPAGKSTVA